MKSAAEVEQEIRSVWDHLTPPTVKLLINSLHEDGPPVVKIEFLSYEAQEMFSVFSDGEVGKPYTEIDFDAAFRLCDAPFDVMSDRGRSYYLGSVLLCAVRSLASGDDILLDCAHSFIGREVPYLADNLQRVGKFWTEGQLKALEETVQLIKPWARSNESWMGWPISDWLPQLPGIRSAVFGSS